MKVATYYNNRDIRIEDRSVPKIGAGELLVKIRSTSICGSDVMEWYRTEKVGRVLGHEISGEIVEMGAGLSNTYKVGNRITASHHVPCYQCHFCDLGHHTLCDTLKNTNFDPGGFAEYVRIPAINVRHGVYGLPENVSYEEGTFVEPVACTIRAQRKAGVRSKQTILVVGCGVSGLLHVMVARAWGVKRILATDLSPYRLDKARDVGADFALEPKENLLDAIRSCNEGRLADVVIVCTTVQKATEQALACGERGSTILLFALAGPEQVIPFPMNEIFWKKGMTLTSSYAACPEEHHESLELIRTGKVPVGRLITHRLSFDQIGRGFEIVSEAKNSLKVILNLPARE